ncbi:MAG: N-carbamoyl-L-amino acid amidohydrolase [Chitinophagaceae bacterium]|nr:N-carbamoyl-L-amino acid amidohydrolase [Chitinophagaceae bacterium]
MPKSPYLLNENRLADVVAAIQVMGTYKFYKLTFAGWSDRIYGDESKADYWKIIFLEHPEFFRLDEKKEKASLVWRRQHPKRYNVDLEKLITREEFIAMPNDDKARVSRLPLTAETIQSLIATAIDMHSRALQFEQDKRWLINLVISGVGGLLGAIIGGVLKK